MSNIHLQDLGCPLAVCTSHGVITNATPSAQRLLMDAGVRCETLPFPLPLDLWEALIQTPLGQSTEWRPMLQGGGCIGLTRHAYGEGSTVLLMREISDAQEQMRRRLQKQRLETIGRLVGGIAHDLRAPLASIMFGANVLAHRCHQMGRDQIREKLEQINAAATRQQDTIAGLLDFARLGPPVKANLSLESTLSRVIALLRPTLREGNHNVEVDVDAASDCVYGNPLTVEQILVNLIVNASESRTAAVNVHIEARRHPTAPLIRLHVRDDGPGVPPALREQVFEPFFTTKPESTGLGLVTAREAARELGGNLFLSPSRGGAHFVLILPAGRCEDPRVVQEGA